MNAHGIGKFSSSIYYYDTLSMCGRAFTKEKNEYVFVHTHTHIHTDEIMPYNQNPEAAS